MNTKLSKVVSGLAGIALIAGVASFSTELGLGDNQTVIKVAQANETTNNADNQPKKRKGGASKQ